MIKEAKLYTIGPNVKELAKALNKTPEYIESKLDVEGTTRHILDITIGEYTDDVIDAIRQIVGKEYALPVKYLKLVPGSYQYVAQKSRIFGKDHDVRNAGITIEPTNPDIAHLVTYTPINQSIPLGTVVNLDVSIPYDSPDGKLENEPDRCFIWSDNLEADSDLESIILKEKSIYKYPWIRHCHYCAVEIGSMLHAKFVVSQVDVELIKSFQLFRFERSDNDHLFRLMIYDCFNLTMTDILKMLKAECNSPEVDAFIDEVIKKMK